MVETVSIMANSASTVINADSANSSRGWNKAELETLCPALYASHQNIYALFDASLVHKLLNY